ncbi:MAG TPA: nucleotide sugar dehydrogenase [Solirubrobacteraceae bacterium]|nr:nucleotide sugar dehydrogenase [Solirubrobacteraceae bacterium]
MRAVVVALGKIGLPLAVQLARAGHEVVGCDIDAEVVATVAAGRAPFPGEEGLALPLEEAVGAGRLRASTDTAAAVRTGPDLVALVPPLVVDAANLPAWGALDAVCAAVGAGLQQGTTVALETTVPVGTTRQRVAPALEAASGLTAGRDFDVVFSPERVSSGRVLRDLATYPKLVGGLDPAGEARGTELYASFVDAEVRALGSAETAELAKLAETTYRDVNIALANEFARHADELGVDVATVIEAANSQPYSHIHRPGVAVGGHCIPVYPRFYLAGHPTAMLPAMGRAVNEQMPGYAAELLGAALGGLDGARVAVLGIAYRGGVRETAFSGARALAGVLAAAGAQVVATDPLYSPGEVEAEGFVPWDGLSAVDGAVVQADHAEYADLTPGDLPGVRAVVDGRWVLDPEPFRAAGVTVRRIGRP